MAVSASQYRLRCKLIGIRSASILVRRTITVCVWTSLPTRMVRNGRESRRSSKLVQDVIASFYLCSGLIFPEPDTPARKDIPVGLQNIGQVPIMDRLTICRNTCYLNSILQVHSRS